MAINNMPAAVDKLFSKSGAMSNIKPKNIIIMPDNNFKVMPSCLLSFLEPNLIVNNNTIIKSGMI